jgi:hypothetical protein
MPAIDLRSILTPVVGLVADTVFPDLVAIEEPAGTTDDTGDYIGGWAARDEDVPALIEPLSARTAAYFATVPTTTTDVTITLAGDRDVRPEYRIRSAYTPPDDPFDRNPDVWDVVGVSRDPARATTIVLGRSREPGTPDEAGS